MQSSISTSSSWTHSIPDSDRYHDVAMRQEDKEGELYEQYQEAYVWELPQRELDAFSKAYEAFHGYTPYLV